MLEQLCHGHSHLRARRHSGPLSNCFRFMCQTGGKPSTWFPLVGLVELTVLRKPICSLNLLRTFQVFRIFKKSHKNEPLQNYCTQMEIFLHYHLALMLSRN